MTGYESKRAMAQAKVEGPIHVVCQCDKCKTQPAQEQRPWVGLTDDEIKEIVGPWGDTPIKGYTRELIDKIEAKLKEKNNG